jgi:hypothetical protein
MFHQAAQIIRELEAERDAARAEVPVWCQTLARRARRWFRVRPGPEKESATDRLAECLDKLTPDQLRACGIKVDR